ncbi:MAG: E3 binding domain-containing protein, partial [Bryobacteraceae bacterium]|nr:E3 binding domain-containing protein [Bryobacteraceae bacterium]
MTDVVMPQMGESIVEGTLTKWLKKAGERIERDEPLFEISTDKVDTEIPSPAAGVLSEVLVEEGNTVAINTVVARIDEGGGGAAAPAKSEADRATPEKELDSALPRKTDEAADQQAAAEAESEEQREKPGQAAASAPEPQAKPAEAEVQGPLSPLVKRMAREYNIDLRQVKGTGAGGRITKADIESYISAQAARTVSQAQAPAEPAPA